MDEWKKKSKGNAKIYTHPNLKHAIVENNLSIRYNGNYFPSVDAAKKAALNDSQEKD